MGRAKPGVIILSGILFSGLVIFAVVRLNPIETSQKNEPPATALKILVREDGLYTLALDELREMGLDTANQVSKIQLDLRSAGKPVPYTIIEDTLIFYGLAPTSRYQRDRPYILTEGLAGEQMPVVKLNEAAVDPARSVPQLLHIEENHLYESRARQEEVSLAENNPWFWLTVQVQSEESISFLLPETVGDSGTLRLGLYGVSHNDQVNPDHDLDLLVNGQRIGEITFDGDSFHTADFSLPDGLLRPGTNVITLDNQPEGNTLVDIINLDWVEIGYQLRLDGSLKSLSLPGADGAYSLAGLDENSVVVDRTDPWHARLLTGWKVADAALELTLPNRLDLEIADREALKSPEEIVRLKQTDLRVNVEGAELLIIASASLIDNLRSLAQYRIDQGISTRIVDINELYDEFGFGQQEPQSITNFLQLAAEKWTDPRPRYVLLVGKGSYDYRDYLDLGASGSIPAPMVPVTFGGETVSDARMADIDGDGLPDFAVGRWPVNDPGQVAELVERTIRYEAQTVSTAASFAIDGSSSEFATLVDQMLYNSAFAADQVERVTGAVSSGEINRWFSDAWLVGYAGHGSLERWGKDSILSHESVQNLTASDHVPLVLQFTCLTSYFAHPTTPSLSEVMLLNRYGPVLTIGATSLTLSQYQEPFGTEMLRALRNPQNLRIGDAVLDAESRLDNRIAGVQEIIDTFVLLGDPSTLIGRPE